MDKKELRKNKGYIDLHNDYLKEKISGIVSRANNILNLEQNKCDGLRDETYSSLKYIKDYVDMFLDNYVPSQEEVEEDA